MRTWMASWLFPLGLTGALVLFSLGSVVGCVLGLLWGLVLVPSAVATMLRRGPGGADHVRDLETNYWRTGPR